MLPDEVHETNIDTVPHLVQWDRPGRPWGREPVSVMGKTTGVYFCKERIFDIIRKGNSNALCSLISVRVFIKGGRGLW